MQPCGLAGVHLSIAGSEQSLQATPVFEHNPALSTWFPFCQIVLSGVRALYDGGHQQLLGGVLPRGLGKLAIPSGFP